MRSQRLFGTVLAVLLVFSVQFSGVVTGQDDLSDDELALAERASAALIATGDYASMVASNNALFDESFVVMLGGQVVGGDDFLIESNDTIRGVVGDSSVNLRQDMTLEITFGEGSPNPGGYSLEGEVRIVDGNIYARGSYGEADSNLPALPDGWVIYEGQPTLIFYPGLTDLNLSALAQTIDSRHFPLAAIIAALPDGFAGFVNSASSEMVTHEDGPTVERITLTTDVVNTRVLAPLFDPQDPLMQVLPTLADVVTEDPLTFTIELTDDGNVYAVGYELAIVADEVDISFLPDAPAGLTVNIDSQRSLHTRLTDINADLELVTAPELPLPFDQPGFSAPPVVEITPWWNDRVFYEIFVRSFYDSDGDGIGDLRGLIERLDYLNDGDPTTTDDLGITGIWLMPIAQSPSYHGYDVTDYYTIEEDYGTNADFQEFMAAAQERGIAVIVDLVMNHTSSEHPWFLAALEDDPAYVDWYIWEAEDQGFFSPWGSPVWHQVADDEYYYGLFWSGMPDLNYDTPEVTETMYEIIDFWLTDMGVDGFRLDAIRHLIEDGAIQENTPATLDWLEGFHDYVNEINPDAVTIGEVWDTSAEIVPYVGDRVDIAFEFDLATAILQAARFGLNTGIYNTQSNLLDLYAPGQYATFLTNHDQDRVMSQLNGDTEAARVAATILLTSPGVPFIYYGEEIGAVGTKPDPDIRTPLAWTAERNRAGFTTGLPWRALHGGYSRRNIETLSAEPNSLWSVYRDLIALRNAYPALQSGAMQLVATDAPSVYSFLRYGEDETLLVVVNLGHGSIDDYTLSVPESLLSDDLEAEVIYGDGEAVPPTLDADGAFSTYTPVATLGSQRGVIIRLR